MLEKASKYEMIEIGDGSGNNHLPRNRLLVLHKETETGSPFLVVAGYFLNEVGKFDDSVLAEIETIAEPDYARLKELIRKKFTADNKTPITFW